MLLRLLLWRLLPQPALSRALLMLWKKLARVKVGKGQRLCNFFGGPKGAWFNSPPKYATGEGVWKGVLIFSD